MERARNEISWKEKAKETGNQQRRFERLCKGALLPISEEDEEKPIVKIVDTRIVETIR